MLFIIPSHLSSSIPPDFYYHEQVEVVEIESSPEIPSQSGDSDGDSAKPAHHRQLGEGIKAFLAVRFKGVRPKFVVMDVMMNWSKEIFMKENIPIVSFFTSCACATAMEYAAWKAHFENVGPDEARLLPGLPESMALTYADTKRRLRSGPVGPDFVPPRIDPVKRWMGETEGSVALLINTCDALEAPFLEYLSGRVEKPVLGVGPLLPETFWKSIGSVVRNQDSGPGRKTNYTEPEVIEWLDSKPRRSVIYISFGSEVGPTLEEYDELAEALAETSKPFIWVIQPGAGKPGPPVSITGCGKAASEVEGGYEPPHGLEERVGKRGLIIKGWAPQVPILSHPSTGGFLSHCGWNSTMEAIGCGVPILGWPIRGDQFYVARLVAKYLNVGHVIQNVDDISKMVRKFDIVGGIEALIEDGEVGDRAMALRGVFEPGFPSSSTASFKALIEHIIK